MTTLPRKPAPDDIPTHMPTDNRPANLGSSINDDTGRLDAIAKVSGRAIYGRDRFLPRGLFVAFVRCPYGAARLTAVDADAARAVRGVVEVEITGDRGQYHGHTVGHVAAESRNALWRGLRALRATWTPESVTTRIEDSVANDPPPPEATRRLMQQADGVLTAVYTTSIQTHSPLETHGAVVDHRGDSATVYSSTQGTFSARDGLDGELGLPRSKYEVVCEYVGGGFGSKLNGAGKEGVLAARISRKHGRPAYVFVDREEDHLDTGNRPSARAFVRIAYKNDGTILGGQVQKWGGVGVGRGGGGMSFPSGRYRLGDLQVAHDDVRFNGGAPRAFRAPGSPQGAFAEELMLDEVATLTGVDPLQIRLTHETDADRRAMLELGARLIGWERRAKTGSQTGVLRRGLGMGTASWGRFPSQAEAEVIINRDGSVEARTGTQDIGTGQRTVMGVMAAEGLGIPLARVNVSIGRSSLPAGPGSGGSVTAHNTAPAMASAAADARRKLLDLVAARLSIDPAGLTIAGDQVMRGNEPLMSWHDACARLDEPIVGRGEWNQASMRRDSSEGHSHGAQFVDLHVDAETGVVRVNRIIAIQACGRVVVRKAAESQIIGGVIQGISYALFENQVLDRRLGSMLNANFDMYKIAGTADMPHIEPILWTRGQTGVRSLGEPPTIPTAGAIACAVFNAIGRPVRSLPITPDRVLAAMEGGA